MLFEIYYMSATPSINMITNGIACNNQSKSRLHRHSNLGICNPPFVCISFHLRFVL